MTYRAVRLVSFPIESGMVPLSLLEPKRLNMRLDNERIMTKIVKQM